MTATDWGWYLIFALGLGSPAVGFAVACLRGGREYARDRWGIMAAYYVAAILLIVLSHGCILYVLPFVGPGVGFALLLRSVPREPTGFCANCGYDLRATPDRCPECGSVPHSNTPPT